MRAIGGKVNSEGFVVSPSDTSSYPGDRSPSPAPIHGGAAPIQAFKLLRLRKDGTLGPLFINRRLVVPLGRWMRAEAHLTKGFAFRPGWHCAPSPNAPHLTCKGRVWCEVEISDASRLHRPASQGGGVVSGAVDAGDKNNF